MSIKAPTVMVSSTYYDLRQIRDDLGTFIERLGYHALLSERPSFPIDPDLDTIENCRRRVERDADVLVLVIGGRYGAVDEPTGKSITNLEYMTARAKGIPIAAFVDKKVLALLPVWKRNPDADFPDVPDARVFGFIEAVRTTDKVWTHEFERAQDITDSLRQILAYWTREGLEAMRLLRPAAGKLPLRLSAQALRLVLERPDSWEIRFFTQVLADELETHAETRMEHRFGIVFGDVEPVAPWQFLGPWVGSKFEQMKRLAKTLSMLINVRLAEAMRPAGTPGDVDELAFVARKIGETYKHLMLLSQRIRCVHVHESLRPVVEQLAMMADQPLDVVEETSRELTSRVAEQLALPPEERVPITIETVLELRNQEALEAAIGECGAECLRLIEAGELDPDEVEGW